MKSAEQAYLQKFCDFERSEDVDCLSTFLLILFFIITLAVLYSFLYLLLSNQLCASFSKSSAVLLLISTILALMFALWLFAKIFRISRYGSNFLLFFAASIIDRTATCRAV